MPLIIDGNNVMGFGELTESELIDRLTMLSRAKSLRIVVCFDGAREHGKVRLERGRLTILYSGHYRSADDLILDQVSRLRNKHNWAVHTNDRELAAEVRGFHIPVQRVEPLLVQLGKLKRVQPKSDQPEKPLSEWDVEGLVKGMLGE